MTDVRRLHVAGQIIVGMAIAAALLGHPIAAAVALSASQTLLIWSLDALRARLDRETRP